MWKKTKKPAGAVACGGGSSSGGGLRSDADGCMFYGHNADDAGSSGVTSYQGQNGLSAAERARGPPGTKLNLETPKEFTHFSSSSSLFRVLAREFMAFL